MPASIAEPAAWVLFESLRWPGGRPDTCPRCSGPGPFTFLSPRNGARRTRTGAVSFRRIWRCGQCRGQFSVLTGTVLAHTRTPLSVWLAAAEQHVTGAGGVTASSYVDRHVSRVLERVDVEIGRASGLR